MTKRKALIDIAYDVLSSKKRPLAFKDLWLKVASQAELSQEEASEQLGRFYSDMSLDSRFVQKDENKWDLKKRYKFAETFVELDIDSEDDEVDDYYQSEEEKAEEIQREEEEEYY